LKTQWNSPIYAFFKPNPTIEYVGGRRSHVFQCNAKCCTHGMHWFLDKGDARSTGNMCKHVKRCWGKDVMHQVLEAKSFKVAQDAVKCYQSNGIITATFERKSNTKKTYSHLSHTKLQTR
ncbi:hypothetical protein SCLCIDRAFT_133491, partial [Scleroderma citrinum Foug A]